MDFSFTEDQQQLQALAARILGDRVDEDMLRRVETGESRFDAGVWRDLATAGLLGIGLPEALGGGGLGMIEQCLVLEEVGRTLAPVPVLASIVAGAMPIATFGTPAQAARWVPGAADGTTILTAALVEPLNRDPAAPTTSATPDGDGWRLTGTKTCVPAGMAAAAALVPAATPEGTGVFIVELDGAGVTRTPQHTTNRETEACLELEGAPGEPLPGAGGDSGRDIVEWILQRTMTGLCAMQLGVCEEALRRTAAYTIEREQFERPIATFQAVGHRCADAYIDVEGIRLTLWQAAWLLAQGLPAALEVDVAKLWAADGGHRVAHAAVHLHGGMGVATEYPIHRYFLAAKQVEFTLGNATEQRLRIGARLAAQPA